MHASAIYSKSGKGVQEASGKTSHLSRSDRAVLSAIDGRATLADVAQKVGKTFDSAFERLIEALDKGGFIREVSPGAAGAAPKPGPGAKPAAKAAAPVDPASDLDFTTALSIPRGRAASPKQTATIPPPPPPPSADEKAKAERIAREQQEAFVKAREEAERKVAAERERVKAEAEAKMRAETEAKLRAEAEAKVKAEAEAKVKAAAEAKVKAAREAAAKAAAAAKAKAEAEAKQAREEVERIRKEAEEKARREQEELRRKLEEERRAREEAERRAQEEARRLEEERRKLEEERKRIEEERTRREQEEQMAKARARAAEREPEPEISLPEIAPVPAPAPTPAPAKASGGGFSDSLLADLESFTNRDAEEQKERDEALRKEREAAVALAREVQERRMREDAERQEQDAKAQRKREDAERKAREEAELREREEREQERLREEEEKRKREAEEREKKAKDEEQLAAKSTRTAAFDAAQRAKRERDLMARSRRQQASAAKAQRRGWGKPIALTLFLLLVIAVAVAHVMPIDTLEYERAASEALGRPVKVGSARLWLVTGLQVRLSDVDLGEGLKIAQVRAYPAYDAILGPRKAFSRIEIDNLKLDQGLVGPVAFTKVRGYNFSIGRIVAKNLELTGPLALPKGLEAEVVYGADGAMRAAVVRGPEGLVARLNVKGGAIDTDMSAASFTLPFAPEISLSKFSLKGTATPQGMQVSEWDGALLNGTLSGTANVRWGESWIVDGVVTARNINAAVFAPALLSDGKAEGSGKFSMRGQPGKLASSSRLDGSFTVTRGVLGSIDLSRAIQTGGKTATGRTQFNEMNGQATYDRGAVALRNVTIGAGQLNAGASADIAQNGALSGRIVADVRVASQTLRATLNLGGTVKEPQVKN
jgi:hypothetical protein